MRVHLSRTANYGLLVMARHTEWRAVRTKVGRFRAVKTKKDSTVKTLTLKKLLTCTTLASIALLGCSKQSSSETAPSEQKSATAMPGDMAKVSVTVGEDGFAPSSIKAKKGEPLMIEFTRTSDHTCAKAVTFPELNLTKDLPLNTPVAIHVPTDQARTLTFQCGMGMYKSSVVVM
jgi:plastocyanin domain-containing protein